MKRLFLVRHCASTGQEASAPLTAAGHTQAVRLAEHFTTQGVELLVSSPYTRAQQSIAPLARCLRLPVETDTRLAERILSATPLLHWREAVRQTFADLDLTWPGGESSRSAMRRGRAAGDLAHRGVPLASGLPCAPVADCRTHGSASGGA